MTTPTDREANFLARRRMGLQTSPANFRRLAMIGRMIEKGWIARDPDGEFQPTPEGIEALKVWRSGKGLRALP